MIALRPPRLCAAPGAGIAVVPHRAAARLEAELLRVSPCFPLVHRTVWCEAFGGRDDVVCAALDGAGHCAAGVAVEAIPTRCLPGHRTLRVQRYTPCADTEIERRLLTAVRDLATRDPRTLRLSIELFILDQAARIRSERLLAELGFAPLPEGRRYGHTLVLDLGAGEEELLARLHKTARRNIREIAKHPLRVAPIGDETLAERLEALQRESLRRTGGGERDADWAARIGFSRRFPKLSRLVGLFRTDSLGPESLLAFAWGQANGDHAHYDASGATRGSGLRVSLAYALLWDLICWSRGTGAIRFDLGGVTPGHLNDGSDALGGVSDFKRYFSREVVQVGGEWIFEPRPVRAALARSSSQVARALRHVVRERLLPA